MACHNCELGNFRKENNYKIVWGEGSLNARIMLVGEAPGENEALEGRPFIGRSGKLLRKLLSEFLDIKKDIFITNTVLCRPPNNREPNIEEQLSCYPHLDTTFHLIKPKLILTAGKVAAEWLSRITHKDYKIYQLEEAEWDDVWFLWLPLYHPSYLLRKPTEKDKFKATLEKYSKIIKKLVR